MGARSSFGVLALTAAALLAIHPVAARTSASGSASADHTPPRITSHSDAPDPISPNGDGKDDRSTIHWTLKDRALVTLKIFKLHGHMVRDLMRDHLAPGKWHITWNGKNNAHHVVPDGDYRYRIRASDKAGNARAVKGTITVK